MVRVPTTATASSSCAVSVPRTRRSGGASAHCARSAGYLGVPRSRIMRSQLATKRDRLGDVARVDGVGILEVRDGPCDTDDAVIATRGEPVARERPVEELVRGIVEVRSAAELRERQLRVRE